MTSNRRPTPTMGRSRRMNSSSTGSAAPPSNPYAGTARTACKESERPAPIECVQAITGPIEGVPRVQRSGDREVATYTRTNWRPRMTPGRPSTLSSPLSTFSLQPSTVNFERASQPNSSIPGSEGFPRSSPIAGSTRSHSRPSAACENRERNGGFLQSAECA